MAGRGAAVVAGSGRMRVGEGPRLRAATGLGAYLSGLRFGSSCFACGARLEACGTAGGPLLSCRSCGAEVVQLDDDEVRPAGE